MKTNELKSILETLKYGIDKCHDDKGGAETHFNTFQNAICEMEKELNKHPIKTPIDLLVEWEQFRRCHWWESDSIDVDKLLMDKFSELYRLDF